MKVSSNFFGIILVITFISVTLAKYDEICTRVVDGMKFREPGNCQAFVTCKNGTGTLTTCPENQLYDKDTKKCASSVDDSYCQDKCKNKKTGKYVADPANCNGYFYCQSGNSVKGTCPGEYHFDEDSEMCIFKQDSECTVISDFCGILPSKASYSNPDNCNNYFVCSKNSAKKTTCKSGLYYDVASEKCKNLHEVPCKAHTIPSNICGRNNKPISNKYVNDEITCQGYYYCNYKGQGLSDKKPTWFQCADGLFFNSKEQACYDPTETSCKKNRCQGRGDLKVISETWGCRHYYVCQDGLVVEERKCPRDMYFDEKLQACTLNETFYSVCDN